MEMLKKLWCGEYSLVKTYWLFYVLLWNVALLPLVLFRQTTQNTQDSYLILGLLFAVIFITYGCVVLVGLWRSTNKYGGWWLWANLAKVVVLLGIIVVAVSIFGALQTNLLYGGVLLLSAVATLTLIKFYGTDGYIKNVKIFIGVCLVLIVMFVVSLGLNVSSLGYSKKSNWTPLVKLLTVNSANDGMSEGMAYLDFSSITTKNDLRYAYTASEFYRDGEFNRTMKNYLEFDCSVPKYRILTQAKFSKSIQDGFGEKLTEDSNYQATEAKNTTSNGGVYTGGWRTYNDIQQETIEYCGYTSQTNQRLYKSLCSAMKRDMAILKSVCENK